MSNLSYNKFTSLVLSTLIFDMCIHIFIAFTEEFVTVGFVIDFQFNKVCKRTHIN